MSVTQISAKALQKKLNDESKLFLLDVRELYEFEYASIQGSLHMPMNQVPERLDEIDASIACAVICHHGIRSQHVADFLVHNGFDNVFNLTGGIDAWSMECDHTVSRY